MRGIYNILSNIRKTIANYLKHMYRSSQIGGSPESNIIVDLDKSLFLHDNNEQLWILGAKETTSNKFRLDIIKNILNPAPK